MVFFALEPDAQILVRGGIGLGMAARASLSELKAKGFWVLLDLEWVIQRVPVQ
jgi:hypothetical protein